MTLRKQAKKSPPGQAAPCPALKRLEMSCEQTFERLTIAGAGALDQMQGRLDVG